MLEGKLLIIDAYGFVFRAYHAGPRLSSPDGIQVGVLYGFTSMLIKVLNDFKPQKALIIFDSGGKNFRHKIYPEYKAHRPELAKELIDQLSLVRIAAKALNFHTTELSNYEADDIIATIATTMSLQHKEVVIISSDKDLMQLMNDYTKLYDPIKDKYITDSDVLEKFGVDSAHLRCVMALIGDRSDNIPGVASIGPKTASTLINQFGSLHSLYDSLDQVANLRQRNILAQSKELAFVSYELVGLDQNVPLNIDLDNLHWTPPSKEKISEFLEKYGFKSLYKRVANLFNIEISELKGQIQNNIIEIKSDEEMALLLVQARNYGIITIYPIIFESRVTNILLAVGNQIYNILYNDKLADNLDLFNFSKKTIDNSIISKIFELLEDLSIKKITFGLKTLLKIFDIKNASSFEDLELMNYLLFENHTKNIWFDPKIKLLDLKISEASQKISDFSKIYHELIKELQKNKLLSIYKSIDLPLCYVLHRMEKIGIKLDGSYLKQLFLEFSEEIVALEQEIFKLTGTEFNIGSPKQLGEILFEKMQLPFGKISEKSKAYGTDVDVLEKLKDSGHEIADLLLKWRQLSKLKNTYTDNLIKQINKDTGRIHTTFLQTSTSTARLSSHEPNLENIPIRSIEGNKIRKSFVTSKDYKLVALDYSQIELRIVAHMADVKLLKQAFLNEEDIHTQTACNIFKLDKNDVSIEYRRRAKAINFGIIYGIGSFGLARQLGVSMHEASGYINEYFLKYPEIKAYMDDTINFARKHSYVYNLFGRKCFTPLINDPKHVIRQSAERAAINARIQSTSADMIKIAMIKIDKELISSSLKTNLLLQIHDELLFEVPIGEVDMIVSIAKNIMENCSESNLSLKPIVDVKIGDNLGQMDDTRVNLVY